MTAFFVSVRGTLLASKRRDGVGLCRSRPPKNHARVERRERPASLDQKTVLTRCTLEAGRQKRQRGRGVGFCLVSSEMRQRGGGTGKPGARGQGIGSRPALAKGVVARGERREVDAAARRLTGVRP